MATPTRLLAFLALSAATLIASSRILSGQTPPAPNPAAATQCSESAALPNAREPLPGVLTGGQPTEDQVAALAASGYRTLVSLRTAAEGAPSLAEPAARLGLRYVELPIAGAQDLTRERAEQLGRVLLDATARPVVIFCAGGNRAGALLAIEQAQVEGKAPEAALAVGLAGGLTKLEPAVREILGLPPALTEPSANGGRGP